MRMDRWRDDGKVVAGFLVAMVIAGCSSPPMQPSRPGSRQEGVPYLPPANSGRGGYYLDDGPGDNPPPNLIQTPDAEPRVEPYYPKNSRPYTALGKTYVPIIDDRPYKQRGRGSWYGKKFHGKRTASGEKYDMYKMTAAHAVLPIPSYARVTNLSNGKQVIVRINDRGPFRSGRLIDLSYTAALRLGYLGHGSDMLEVERLLPDDIRRGSYARARPVTPSDASPSPTPTAATPSIPRQMAAGYYLQLGAFSKAENAEAQRMRYALEGLETVGVERHGTLYRLMAGPYPTREHAASAAAQLRPDGSKPVIVQR